MPFGTPMVRYVSRAIFNHTNPDVAKVLSSPICNALISFMLGSVHCRPISDSERNIPYIHLNSLIDRQMRPTLAHQ